MSCNYSGILGAFEFVCSVSAGNGNLLSVQYSLNGYSRSGLRGKLYIHMSVIHIANTLKQTVLSGPQKVIDSANDSLLLEGNKCYISV